MKLPLAIERIISGERRDVPHDVVAQYAEKYAKMGYEMPDNIDVRSFYESTIGTELEKEISRRGYHIECDDCKREVRSLDLKTREEVEEEKEKLIARIVERARTKAPIFWRTLAKVDHFIEEHVPSYNSKAESEIREMVNLAIERGAAPPEPEKQAPRRVAPVGKPRRRRVRKDRRERQVAAGAKKRNRSGQLRKPIRDPDVCCPALPLENVGPRHLIYHIYPVSGTGMWQWNVQQLLKRIDLFDGVRSVAVMSKGTPGNKRTRGAPAPPKMECQIDSLEDVKDLFSGHRVDNWIVKPNDPRLREVSSRGPLMKTLPTSGVTFSGHAKGITYDLNAKNIVDWVQVMYESCLDDWDTVESHLKKFHMTGAFKVEQRFGGSRWHYSGSFYWFRNSPEVLGSKLSQLWYGTEEWPGVTVDVRYAGCLVGEGIGSNGQLYRNNVHDLIGVTT